MSGIQTPSSVAHDPVFRRYVRAGDGEAFRTLVDRHLPAVRGTASRVLGPGSPWIDDVAQEVFLSLARKAGMLPGHLTLSAWLHRQTVRRAIDVQRSEAARHRRELATDLQSDPGPVAGDQMIRDLDRELLRLPERDREILILRFMDNFSSEQIGRKLGMGAASVRKRIERSIAKLKERLCLTPQPAGFTRAALATCLGVSSSSAGTPQLAATICARCMAATASKSFLSTLITTLIMKKTQTIAIAATLLAATGVLLADRDKPAAPTTAGKPGQPASPPAPAGPARAPAKPALPVTKDDRIARLKFILSLGDDTKRIQELANFLALLDPHEFGEMIDCAKAHPHMDSNGEIRKMMYMAWARHDRAAVFAKLKEDQPADRFDPIHPLNVTLAVAIMREFAAEDPGAAVLFASEQFTAKDPRSWPEYQRKSITAVFDVLAGKDLPFATASIARFERFYGVNEAIAAVVDHVRAEGDQALLEWVDGLPPETPENSIRGRALLKIAQDMLAKDGGDAMDFALKYEPEITPDSTALQIIGIWHRKDAGAARSYVEKMPAGEMRDHLMAVIEPHGKSQSPSANGAIK